MFGQRMILALVAGFGAGIFLRSFIAIPWVVAASAAVASVPLLIVMVVRPPTRRIFALLLLFIVSASAGVLRYDWKDAGAQSRDLDSAVGREAELRGVIASEPDEREKSVRLVVEARELKSNGALSVGEWKKIQTGFVLATVSRFPEFSYGDIVELRGILKAPENFADNFDYRAYLAKDGILWEFYFPEIERVGAENGAWIQFRRALFSLKRAYLGALAEVLPEPNASLVGGLTVGARKALPEEVLDDFRAAGVLHIVVLSGYNMTLIARMVAGVAPSFIPYALRLGAGLAGIAAFALMAGATATVVRASLMAAVLYVAGISGRVYQAKIALIAAGLLMLVLNPKLLRFDLSFQLSFLATAGLLWLAPKIEPHLTWLPKMLGREYAVSTLAAQIAVTPLLLHSMGTISLAALPANILILLAVPFTMAVGALAGIAGMIHAAFATPFAWASFALTHYELFVAHWFGALPLAQLDVGFVAPVIIVAAYTAILGWVFWPVKTPPVR